MNNLAVLQDLLIEQYSLTREQLGPEVELATVGVDSLGLIELMFQVEDRFGITLPDDHVPVLVTIHDVVAYVDTVTAAVAAKTLPPEPSVLGD